MFPEFDRRLVLTDPNGTGISQWRLPRWFYPDDNKPPSTYHSNRRRWRRDADHAYLRSVGRGQEFVLDLAHYPEAVGWLSDLVSSFGSTTRRSRRRNRYAPTERRRRDRASTAPVATVDRDTSPNVNGAVIMAVNSRPSCCYTGRRATLPLEHQPEQESAVLTESSLLINVNEILSFFDEKPDWADRHSAAVVSMIFEDLAAATLEHCLLRNGATTVNVRSEPVTTGQKKGPRLDRWIEADLANGQQVIFQTEMKSLSAQSLGHETIALDASEAELRQHEQGNWDRQWDPVRNTLIHQRVAKVLIPMKHPAGTEHRTPLPLLVCWNPLGPSSPSQRLDQVAGGHLFKVTDVTYQFTFPKPHSWKINPKFSELWVFSVSGYLRSIRSEISGLLELKMPDAAKKMRALLRVVQVPS